MAIFTSDRRETAVTRPFRNLNGKTFNGQIPIGHNPTDASVRSGVTAMSMYVTAVAVGQSQRLYSGVGIFTGDHLSFP
jgi:hypothetical protein